MKWRFTQNPAGNIHVGKRWIVPQNTNHVFNFDLDQPLGGIRIDPGLPGKLALRYQ